MVTYDYDSNAILVQPLPNREAASITKAWETTHARLAKPAAAPKHNILDNEFSAELKRTLDKHGVTYEKVPPYIHRRNAAERAIRTFKNNFLAGLAGVHPDFPIKQWDHLLQQAEIHKIYYAIHGSIHNYRHMLISLATLTLIKRRLHHQEQR